MNFGVSRFRSLLFVSCASYAVENLMDFTDLAIAGNVCGEAGIGGVELYGCMTELLYFTGAVIANGTANFFSEAAGRFDRAAMVRWFSNGLILSLLGGLVCAVVSLLVRDPYLAFVGAGEATRAMALPYWNGYVPQALLQPFAVYLATLVYVDGDTRTCTAAFTTELAVNAVASFLLCRGLGTTAGCAYGTALGSLASLTVLSTHFLRRSNALAFRWTFSWASSLKTVVSDFSESGCALYLVGINALMSYMLVRWFGDSALVTMAVVVSVYGFLLFLDGVAAAARPIVGVYMGERNYPAVRTVAKRALAVSWAFGALAGLCLFAFPDLPGIILGVTDATSLEACRLAVTIVAASCFFHGPVLFFIPYLLFVGRPALSLALSIFAQTVMPVAGFLAGGVLAGFGGFWLGYAFSGPLALALFLAAFALLGRRRELPFFLPRDRDERIANWELRVTPESVCRVSAEVVERLARLEASPRVRVRAGMIVEESLMSVYELNRPSSVSAEVTLDTNEDTVLVLRDDGRLAARDDVSGDQSVALRSIVLKGMHGLVGGARAMTAIGFNRKEIRL